MNLPFQRFAGCSSGGSNTLPSNFEDNAELFRRNYRHRQRRQNGVISRYFDDVFGEATDTDSVVVKKKKKGAKQRSGKKQDEKWDFAVIAVHLARIGVEIPHGLHLQDRHN